MSRPDRDAAAPVASQPPAAPKWLRQPLTKLILAAGSTAVLLLGWFSAPARDVPAPVVVPEDRVAPLLEAEMARRRSLQAFERVQEIGGRVIGYSVAMAAPAEAARRTVGAAELPFESPVLPRAFGVVVSSDGLIVTHAAGLDDGLIEPVLMQNGATVDAEVLVFEEATGLVLLRVPSGADLPVAPLAVARPASGALATAAGRWPHADIIVPVFVMASTNERYRISGAESLPPGTPLFNGDGELFSVLGRRFAYPAREAFARLSARLAAGIGHASALDLGLQDRSADLARWFGDRGVIVARVGSSGSVAEAGMRPGDLILEINGSGVDSAEAARAAIAAIPAGQAVTLSGTAAAARGTRVPFERTVTSSSAFALRGGVTMPEGAAGEPRLGDLLAAGPVGAEDRGLPLQARVLQIDGVVPRTPAQASAALRRAMRGPRGALLYVDDGTERFFVGLPGVER